MIEREANFYEFVYTQFYKFSQTKPEEVGLFLSKALTYPLIELKPNLQFTIPLPKMIDEKYVFEGMLFENTDGGRRSLWTLFLATLYHLAAHAAISEYGIYDKWKRGKTEEVCYRVIDFIEDVRVQKYILHSDEEIWQNVHNTEFIFTSLQSEKETPHNKSKSDRAYRIDEIAKNREQIREKIFSGKNEMDILSVANFLYDNRELLSGIQLPYVEHHSKKFFLKFETSSPQLKPSGIFEEQVEKLDELWEIDEHSKNRLLRGYKKHLKNLNFDMIVIPPGNLHHFAQLKTKTLPMLRRVRQQIRLISNLVDDPKIDEIGQIDMQLAIQAIASEGKTREIFERDELRRGEEAWIVLVDKSASMRLRFDRIKEFTVCVSESASELTGRPDAWALFSFDNNFQILKDFKEKYTQEVQARIGGMEYGGLSLLSDALELANRILTEDPRERKYIFVITDGHPSGYEKIHAAFSKIVKKTEASGITLVAIGVSKSATRRFKNSARGSDLKQLVAKFITAYRTASSDM